MGDEDIDKKQLNRRWVATNLISAAFGWALGSGLDVFRRPLTGFLGDSPIGRHPDMNVSIADETIKSGSDYTLLVTNEGLESADRAAIYVTFEQKIDDYRVVRYGDVPPYPKYDILVRDDGGANIRFEGLPRSFSRDLPILIEFSVSEEDSTYAPKIREKDSATSKNIIMYMNGRVTWTFLGEREYSNSGGVFLPPINELPVDQ